VHLFTCIRCDGDEQSFLQLAQVALRQLYHGCSYFCLSYDQSLRDVIHPDPDSSDHRPVPCITQLAALEPSLDFSADYVGGSQAVLELQLAHSPEVSSPQPSGPA
jgi:hypothetical protein